MDNLSPVVVGFDSQSDQICPESKTTFLGQVGRLYRIRLYRTRERQSFTKVFKSAQTHIGDLIKAVRILQSSSASRFVWGTGSIYSYCLTLFFGECFGTPKVLYFGEAEYRLITSRDQQQLQRMKRFVLKFFLKKADIVLTDEVRMPLEREVQWPGASEPIAIGFEDFIAYCEGSRGEGHNIQLEKELTRIATKIQVAKNITVHDGVAHTYEDSHAEIFNEPEQKRLAKALANAMELIQSTENSLAALDYGCGSGNLTHHLSLLTANVVSADISKAFLDGIRKRFPTVKTCWLRDGELGELADERFDIIALYSVLHHIPDYLDALTSLADLVKPGGVIFLDHEPTPEYWNPTPIDLKYRRSVEKVDFRKFLKASNYWYKLRRIIDPRFTNEGDIHVWPDDHVEWPKIDNLLKNKGFEVVMLEDYLLFKGNYKPHVYANFEDQCKDMRLTVYRKSLVHQVES